MRIIDINNKYFYEHNKSENLARTKNRLIQISELGLIEVAEAQFGIENVLSGLYIEMVWSYNDHDWNEYILWIKSVLTKHNIKINAN